MKPAVLRSMPSRAGRQGALRTSGPSYGPAGVGASPISATELTKSGQQSVDVLVSGADAEARAQRGAVAGVTAARTRAEEVPQERVRAELPVAYADAVPVRPGGGGGGGGGGRGG